MQSAVILAALYALECSAALGALALYKKGDRAIPVFLASPAGYALMGASLAAVVSLLAIVLVLRQLRPRGGRLLASCLALNLSSVTLAWGSAEILIRALSVRTPAGTSFAHTLLLPRSWEAVAARYREILARAAAQGSYLVFDDTLGWTVGRARRSRNGLYLSSVEGLRSPRLGMTLADRSSRHRIALVGDSFTFGLEVPYADTWGSHLEHALGPDWQVLNFGVDGYGVDQAVLRYERDVLSWNPEIVILGVINHDLRRTLGVYAFLTFPLAEIPFPKPRFVLRAGALEPLNLPLPPPAELFDEPSIADLPFIDYDRTFQEHPAWEWERHFYHHSYAVRFLLSRFPRWPSLTATADDSALRAVNGALLARFVKLARRQGSTPIVVFFPGEWELPPLSELRPGVAVEVLHEQQIPYLDMTGCVLELPPGDRFLSVHYSPAANSAIARCLGRSLRSRSQATTP